MKPFVYNLLWKSSLYFLRVRAVGLFLTARAFSQLSSASTGLAPASGLSASHHQKQTLPWFCGHHVQLSGRWRRHFPPLGPETRVGHYDLHIAKGNKLNSLSVVCWRRKSSALSTQSSGQRSWRLSWVLWNFTLIFSILKRKNEMTFRLRNLCQFKEQWLLCTGSINVKSKWQHGQYWDCGSNKAELLGWDLPLWFQW